MTPRSVSFHRLAFEKRSEAIDPMRQSCIDAGHQPLLKREPHPEAKERQSQQQHGGIPGRQSHANRQASHAPFARTLYPTPRTV